MTEPIAPLAADVRLRVVEAAAALLHDDGAAAVTTRAVAQRAGVQAPTIYRLFGDKDGLLDAVAEHTMASFTVTKAAAVQASADDDPVTDLRSGWDATIGFGLANPDLFVIMSDPRRGRGSPAVAVGLELLAARLRRVAAAGRLAVPEHEAIRLVHAAGTGAVLALLDEPEDERDTHLADVVLETVLARILTPGPSDGAGDDSSALRAAAVTLAAAAPDLDVLSPGERAVLGEWLGRIVDHPSGAAAGRTPTP
ncbi:TetR family transcriptional regulator [Curtobacterium sp. MCBA15_009]|uniref:TetR/AcrR family transcriptional regulator n=1 Tax=Curtobacterium sp. MCBA15_009 TaxID=1898737 RepID=UPI0008DD70D6|nr:TetR/AcrR family transcriptional regulator [Curtobacterium sp. MCBA15_009]OII11605.1 TetR family transcriptional regulator [Curtobacterium sp. MCBA15_009]